MKITDEMRRRKIIEYEQLNKLIQERRSFESKNEKVDFIYHHPTSMTFPNIHGWCLLQLAVALGNFDEIRRLVEDEGVDVLHRMPARNQSPLFLALRLGEIDIAEYLLKRGATIADCTRSWLDDPRSLMLYDQQAKILIKSAVESGEISLSEHLPNGDKSYFDLAAEIGDIQTIKLAIEHHGSLNDLVRYSSKGLNVIAHRAIENNQKDILNFILSNGFNLDTVDCSRRSLLHAAIDFENWEIAKLLLERGANANSQDSNGRTPLHLAVMRGNEECIKGLIQYGANPLIITYEGETIFHTNISNENLDLEDFIPDSIELKLLKTKKTIYGEAPDGRSNLGRVELNQAKLVNAIKYYLDLNYRDTSYFSSAGYCNGLSFLFHYYDSHGEIDLFFSIIKAWIEWQGTKDELSKKPKPPLDRYGTLGEVFETFLSQLTLFQVSTVQEIKVRQHDRARQLDFFGMTENFSALISDLDFCLNRSQLLEIFSVFSRFPKNVRIEAGGGQHATACKVDKATRFQYYDPNFDAFLDEPYDSNALVDLIINTKYKKLKQESHDSDQNENRYDIHFTAYHFAWERGSLAAFSYFSESELPSSKQDADRFFTESVNGFNHLHIAVMTNSRENLRILLRNNYCDVNQKMKSYPHHSPIRLLSFVDDAELINIFFSHRDIDLSDTSILHDAYRRGNLNFCNRLISHPNCPLLNQFIMIASDYNDDRLLEILLKENKVDKSQTVADAVRAMGNPDTIESIKETLYKSYHRVRDSNGNGLAHHAVMSSDLAALQYLLQRDSSCLQSRNNSNRIILEEYLSEHLGIIKLLGPNHKEGQILLLLIEHIPDRIEVLLGFRILDVLDAFGEPYCSKYAGAICKAIGGITHAQDQSLFKIDFLDYFAKKNNLTIFRALIERMNSQIVNEQYTANKYTALHYVLNMRVDRESDMEARYEIIERLINQNADLDLADVSGKTCRQIIESLADPRVCQMINSQKSLASRKS